LGGQVNEDEIGRACSRYTGEEKCIQGLEEKPEGKRQLGRYQNGV
jgi:hypothetical protein